MKGMALRKPGQALMRIFLSKARFKEGRTARILDNLFLLPRFFWLILTSEGAFHGPNRLPGDLQVDIVWPRELGGRERRMIVA